MLRRTLFFLMAIRLFSLPFPLHGVLVVVCRPTCNTNEHSTPQTDASNG